MSVEPSKIVDSLAEQTIGAAIEVHRHLGPGFLEGIYEDALCMELALRDIAFKRQVPTEITYKSKPLRVGHIDLVVSDRLVVELKAVKSLQSVHRAQVMAYLKAMDLKLGLLMNFNEALLKDGLKRVIWSRKSNNRDHPKNSAHPNPTSP